MSLRALHAAALLVQSIKSLAERDSPSTAAVIEYESASDKPSFPTEFNPNMQTISAVPLAATLSTGYSNKGRIFLSDGAPPSRLSVLKDHPYFHDCYRRIGVMFDGAELKGVVETYDAVEGWVDVRKKRANGLGYLKDGAGNFIVSRFTGKVEPFWQQPKPVVKPAGRSLFSGLRGEKSPIELATIQKAQEKRERIAERNRRLAAKQAQR